MIHLSHNSCHIKSFHLPIFSGIPIINKVPSLQKTYQNILVIFPDNHMQKRHQQWVVHVFKPPINLNMGFATCGSLTSLYIKKSLKFENCPYSFATPSNTMDIRDLFLNAEDFKFCQLILGFKLVFPWFSERFQIISSKWFWKASNLHW